VDTENSNYVSREHWNLVVVEDEKNYETTTMKNYITMEVSVAMYCMQ